MYLPQKYASAKLQLSADELRDFEAKGVIKALVKDGRVFYSSHDLYRLKGILKLVRTAGLSFRDALERVDAPIAEGIARKRSQ